MKQKLTDSGEWRALAAQRAALAGFHLRDAFAADPQRFARLSRRVQFAGGELLFDFSKHLIDERALELLLRLAAARHVRARIDAMFAGEKINVTEDRAALHVALRDLSARPLVVDGVDVKAQVAAVRERFLDFAERVRAGAATGHAGMRFTDVVNLGIGGSDLGPQMMVQALTPYHDGPRVHFVANVDPAHLASTLRALDPRTTLFIVASKTFTTAETMANARAARGWLAAALGEAAVARHFVAVSANARAVAAFGIAAANMFEFWDWVGGRYSLWSAIGLPIAIAVGRARFMQMLAGAHALDEHFRTAAFADNVPVLAALLGIWYLNFWGAATHSIAPYSQHLARFVAHIQQLDMESNGKRVTADGEVVDYATGPIVWGEPGTNAQHAYFQLLQQGPALVPVDFIVAAESAYADDAQHRLLVANCFAQSAALAWGKTRQEARAEMIAAGLSEEGAERLAPHREFPGNRPSTTILVRRFDPFTLGMLTALYEHKVFVQGAIWNIDSFDQWGVELGKSIAARIAAAFDDERAPVDAASAGLIAAWRAMRR
ncbi:MAG TPA: glucose-6-phosphate isomerase [Burkholderiaceae bacterium]|jgi:glucose-6-phosphate isomerase|nr:glucose-6-phosphate isomerase [Burkholderiaceae bacterium]